jgi:two-component system, OmpR family, response regulator
VTVDAPRRTVLIADDNPAIRILLRAALEERGHRVLEAGSSTDIVWMLESERPDVLLLDVRLGDEDGVAVAAGLRRQLRYSSVRILLMSGGSPTPDLVDLSVCDVPVLAKPFDLAAVLAAIE